MKTAIIVDLDGTLCNTEHRVHLAQAGQWDEFNSLCGNDEPYQDVLTLLKVFSSAFYFEIVVVTGRNEKFRFDTEQWLKKYKVYCDIVLMRPDNNFDSDFNVKLKLIEDYFGSQKNVLENVLFAIDDRDKVIEAFRNYGLPCWQVRPGGY